MNVNLKQERVNLIGGTANPPQEALQVDEKPWVANEDVQAAKAIPEVAAAGVAVSV
ncbi:MAG TPA: hypothetical protein VFI90_13745 [Rubrobacter sp.]|nr:hypothetical protein [Rubrobacter sp.]